VVAIVSAAAAARACSSAMRRRTSAFAPSRRVRVCPSSAITRALAWIAFACSAVRSAARVSRFAAWDWAFAIATSPARIAVVCASSTWLTVEIRFSTSLMSTPSSTWAYRPSSPPDM